MKSVLIIATVLGSIVCTNSALALNGSVFPGKGSKAAWSQACKFVDEGVEIAKTDEAAAIPKFEKAISLYPYSDCFYRNLAVSYEQKKALDLNKAEAAYRKATELDGNDWRNWNGIANVLVEKKKSAEAKQAFQKALAKKPPEETASLIRKSIAWLDEQLKSKNK